MEAASAERGGRVKDLDLWDRGHSWHPFTQMQEYAGWPPLHVERGEGCWLYDVEGRRYLDTNASIWTNVHGHNDPDLNEALREQAAKVAHSTYLGLSHPVGAELGRRLVEIAPESLRRVTFSDNGSSAVEIALKQSFQYWQLVGEPERRLVVGMEGAYHGDTFGCMAVGDSGGFHGRFAPWLFETRRFPAPACEEWAGKVGREDGGASLARLERILQTERGKVASVILEPWIQGAAGMKLQPLGFLREVEELCRGYGVHLILDEVFVGFGRAGPLLVCAEEGVEPDFLCLAKGLTAGYVPLAATLTREEIFEAFLGDFDSGRAFYHGHTFTGNPVAAAVALRSLEKLEAMLEDGSLARRMESFGRKLEASLLGHPNVKALRQRGMAAAVDLYPGGRDDAAWPLNERVGMKVCLAARQRGLLVRPILDTLLLVPPLVIREEEMDFLFENLKATLDVTLASKGKECHTP